MSRYLLIIFSSIYVLSCGANNYPSELIRIESQINNTQLSSSEKIDLILLKANMAIYKGDYANALKWINEAYSIDSINSSDIILIKDTEGEYYYKLSDVEKAESIWAEMQYIFNRSNKLDSSLLALYYSRKGRIANFKIEKQTALKYCEKAAQLLEQRNIDKPRFNLGVIYREYAYARKIILLENINDSVIHTLEKDLSRAILYTEKSLGKNNYYVGGLFHDWANLYFDFTIKKNKKFQFYFDNAIYKYHESIAYNRMFYGNCERIALSYAIMGLLLSDNNLNKALENYNQAIAELLPSFKNNSLYSVPDKIDGSVSVSRMLQFIHYKSSLLLDYYYKTNNTEYLQQAYLHTKAEIIWFEKLFQFSEPSNISFSLGAYNITPYFILADILAEIYTQTPDRKYKEEMFAALQLQKNFSLMAATITNKNDFNHNNFMKQTATLLAVQSKLDNKTAIIECFNNNYVWVMTKTSSAIVKVNYTGYEKLSNAIVENNFQLFKNTAYSLYQSFFKPLEAHLKQVENLVLVPNTITTTLPLEALVYDTANCYSYKDISKHYIINRYKVQYAFSSTVWVNDVKTNTHNNLLCFAPKYEQFASLPFNYNLAKDFSKKYNGNFYLGKEASKSNFINNSQSNNVFHFALHANGKMNDAESARLIFYGNADSAFLTINDLVNCKMTSPLIVMAACKTSLGKNYGGEGILNFAKAFKMVGNAATLNSLWAIDDKATSELLGNFYQYLDGNSSISDALYKAKKDFIIKSNEPENANPLYWAGVVFYGSDNTITINLKQYLPNTLWYAIGLLMFITLVFILLKLKKYR